MAHIVGTKSMHFKKNLFIVFPAIILVLAVVVVVYQQRKKYLVEVCAKNIQAMVYSCRFFAERNGGMMPESIDKLFDQDIADKSIAFCSMHCIDPKIMKLTDIVSANNSYIYINWNIPNRPVDFFTSKYPILYDNSIKNHNNGCNVGFSDGSVIWDKNANLLKEFSRKSKFGIHIVLPSE